MLSRLADAVGNIWGRASTIILALGVAVLPILQGIDPGFVRQHPVLMWAIIIVGILVAVLRVLAPPPMAVSIAREDAVSVDRDAGTVVISKAADIPAKIVDKAPGEKL